MKSKQNSFGEPYFKWWMAAAAALLAVASSVSKAQFWGIEFSGGAPLGTLALAILFYPVIREIASKGGRAEFLGLKVELSELKREAEDAYGLRIEELRTDIEELRQQLRRLSVQPIDERLPTLQADDRVFWEAVACYRENKEIGAWKGRTVADRLLRGPGGRLPVSQLEMILKRDPRDMEVAMAVAVCLGHSLIDESDIGPSEMLITLLSNPFERVRFRAARSMERRAKRSDTSPQAVERMLEGIVNALSSEKRQSISEALKDALRALTSLRSTVDQDNAG